MAERWLPMLCRLRMHRWRAGVHFKPHGTFRCERCGTERTGRVTATDPGRRP